MPWQTLLALGEIISVRLGNKSFETLACGASCCPFGPTWLPSDTLSVYDARTAQVRLDTSLVQYSSAVGDQHLNGTRPTQKGPSNIITLHKSHRPKSGRPTGRWRRFQQGVLEKNQALLAKVSPTRWKTVGARHFCMPPSRRLGGRPPQR